MQAVFDRQNMLVFQDAAHGDMEQNVHEMTAWMILKLVADELKSRGKNPDSCMKSLLGKRYESEDTLEVYEYLKDVCAIANDGLVRDIVVRIADKAVLADEEMAASKALDTVGDAVFWIDDRGPLTLYWFESKSLGVHFEMSEENVRLFCEEYDIDLGSDSFANEIVSNFMNEMISDSYVFDNKPKANRTMLEGDEYISYMKELGLA